MKWIKIILLVCVGVVVSCTEPELPTPPSPTTERIFSVKESSVVDGQDIYFDLPSEGLYTLTLIDKESGQVISRERFNGKSGKNIKNIYTKTIESRYLYLVLVDNNRVELNRTTLILK
jgi:hypothetical protein